MKRLLVIEIEAMVRAFVSLGLGLVGGLAACVFLVTPARASDNSEESRLSTELPLTKASPRSVSMRPELGYVAGAMIEGLRVTVVEQGQDISARSELVWPENALMAGATLAISNYLPGVRLGVGFRTNLTTEWDKMQDSDWLSSKALAVPETKFSYTRSNTRERRSLLFELDAATALSSGVELDFGYRHHFYYGKAVGLDGWQFDMNGNPQPVSAAPDFVGGTVTIHQAIPYFGLNWVPLAGKFTLRTGARLEALYHHSIDDHQYRNKKGTSTGGGLGFDLAVTPSFALSKNVSIGVKFEAEALWLVAGSLHQKFYGDDPSTPGTEGPDTPVPVSDASHHSYHLGATSFVEFAF